MPRQARLAMVRNRPAVTAGHLVYREPQPLLASHRRAGRRILVRGFRPKRLSRFLEVGDHDGDDARGMQEVIEHRTTRILGRRRAGAVADSYSAASMTVRTPGAL